MNLLKVDEVIGDYSGRSRSALEYCLVMSRMMAKSKESGFNRKTWGPLADLVDVEHFERIGNFKEVMDWEGYLQMEPLPADIHDRLETP